ncbi:MAG: hypothetical protein LBR82_00860 [Desulfovibrio sp.]|jgi:hypothetical protein|nr:hypothetical protein [Desulfovibrio sp.]
MSGAAENWREKELSLREVVAAHPQISPFVIIKIDVQRRGVVFSQAAKDAADPARFAVTMRGIYEEKEDNIPNSLLLNDGTSIVCEPMDPDISVCPRGREPYLVEVRAGRTILTDLDQEVAEVEYWPKPRYFDCRTGSGKPMWQIVNARPQRLGIAMYQFCDFWRDAAQGCKFCAIAATFQKNKKDMLLSEDDVLETLAEALKQPGRLRMIQLCCGSMLGGRNLLDDEVDMYVSLLTRMNALFNTKKVLTQLIATAYTEKQLRRLYDGTILSSYTADVEVLNEKIFNWLCPGKAARIGYQGWKERLFKAVEIFGDNHVNTGIVSGVEFAGPAGFTSEEQALESTLREAEDFLSHGVGVAQTIWQTRANTALRRQLPPSLEYLTRLAGGLDNLQRKYNVNTFFDDYRTCGNHPNTDLSRI